MTVASRFAIAVHVLTLLDSDVREPYTSEWMAGSIGVNPVVVRNVTGMLRRAGLVTTQQGVPGANLCHRLQDITLLDVFRAVESDREIFAIHARPNPACPIGARIQATLERFFGSAQQAMERELASTTLEDVVRDLRERSG
jgi:DNA-binding IscR family transcriptional regulator